MQGPSLTRRRRPGGRLEQGAVARQHQTIDAIGLGSNGQTLGKIPGLGRIDDGNRDARIAQRQGRLLVIDPGAFSQRKRKRVDEIFVWLITVGGMRNTRFIGQAKTQIAAFMSVAAYNLLRIAKQTTQVAVSR